MPNLKIVPPSALVTTGQAVTFQATDDKNQPVNVTWNLTPQIGSLVTATPVPPGPPLQPLAQPASPAIAPQGQVSSSATYVAPSVVQTAQTVAVTAATLNDTASVSISLTPDAISIVPAAVNLHARQKQKFAAIVASGTCEAEPLTWILTPQVGALDGAGVYTAPDVIPDDGTLTVTAASMRLGKQVSAKVTLTPEPWRGLGPVLLAGYLLVVFWVVYLMIALWPSEIPNIDALKTSQAQAQASLDKSKLDLKTELGPGNTTPPASGGSAAKPATTAAATTATPRQQASDALLDQLKTDIMNAQHGLDDATEKLKKATSPTVDTRISSTLNREIDLLYLVLLAGALGSFLHMAQSFSAFAGNRTLKSSWVWWYCFLPFVGGGLAMVFYTVLRGGLITIASSSTLKASDLNPYGLVAAAALVGMFSEAATTKLGEVFDTLFQTSKGEQHKDPLKSDPQSNGQPTKPSAAGSGEALGTSKQAATN